jgi:hypothetical protein
MSKRKKLLQKGIKVRFSGEHSLIGEPLAVVVNGIAHTQKLRIGEDYCYLVHFLPPTYDVEMQGPFSGAMMGSEYMTPVGYEYPIRSEAQGERSANAQTPARFTYNLPTALHEAQVAMVELYQLATFGWVGLHSEPVTLSQKQRRDFLEQVIPAARAGQIRCADALPEAQRRIDAARRALAESDGDAAEARAELSLAEDRHYALQQSIRIDEYFARVAREDLAEIGVADGNQGAQHRGREQKSTVIAHGNDQPRSII